MIGQIRARAVARQRQAERDAGDEQRHGRGRGHQPEVGERIELRAASLGDQQVRGIEDRPDQRERVAGIEAESGGGVEAGHDRRAGQRQPQAGPVAPAQPLPEKDHRADADPDGRRVIEQGCRRRRGQEQRRVEQAEVQAEAQPAQHAPRSLSGRESRAAALAEKGDRECDCGDCHTIGGGHRTGHRGPFGEDGCEADAEDAGQQDRVGAGRMRCEPKTRAGECACCRQAGDSGSIWMCGVYPT